MSMRRTYSRVQSFPGPDLPATMPQSPTVLNSDDEIFGPKPENGLRIHRSSSEHLLKVLDDAIGAQKKGMKQAMDAISHSAGRSLDRSFVNCYLDCTVLLLDACNGTKHRLEDMLQCLSSIPIGLRCLEGDHEHGRTVLLRAAAALESSSLRDRQHSGWIEKSMLRIRASGKKLGLAYHHANGCISPELYRALNESWMMAVLAIGELGFATSCEPQSTRLAPPNTEPWAKLKNQLSKKMKVFPKKTEESASMEELKEADLAVQTLLKLIEASQKGGGSIFRRVAVKGVAGELRRRREQLEKTLPQLEEKVGELYRLIVTLRMKMLGFLSEAQKEENRTDADPAELPASKNRVKIQTKLTRRTCSLGQIGSPLRLIKSQTRFNLIV